MLKVVRRDPLPLRVLPGPRGPRVEEIVDALECPTTLSRHLGILADGIL